MQPQANKNANKSADKPAVGQTKVTTGSFVTVICKIPQGILLQLHEVKDFDEVTQGGSRKIKQSFPVGDPVRIKGPAHAQNEGPRCKVTSGFAVTTRVPADHWHKWVEQVGKYLPAYKNGLIQAFPDSAQAKDAAYEARKQKSGLERIDPNKIPVIDPRFKIMTAKESMNIEPSPDAA